MITFLKVLEGALAHLEETEGIQPHEVHEAEIELCPVITTQCCIVMFPEHNYICLTYSDWRPGEFIGYRTDKCYYCGEDEEEGHDCLAGVRERIERAAVCCTYSNDGKYSARSSSV